MKRNGWFCMSKIFCIVGKSCSGKDTLYKAILKQCNPALIPIIPYTTRPKRNKEIEGFSYYFVSNEQLQIYEKENQIVEKREYHTMEGIWSYFTLKFSLNAEKDYLLITTLDGVKALIQHYGSQTVHVIYLNVDDQIRILRCIEREASQSTPNYSEVCRRFIADQKDFSEERLQQFENIHQINMQLPIDLCIKEWEKIYEES